MLWLFAMVFEGELAFEELSLGGIVDLVRFILSLAPSEKEVLAVDKATAVLEIKLAFLLLWGIDKDPNLLLLALTLFL